MNFIKYHKKLIALFVVLSFLYLVGMTSLPLGAEPAPAKAKVGMNGDDQTTGSIEQEGGSGYVLHKGSTIVGILIGVVLVGAVAAVLILVVFKTKYDITGIWDITYIWQSNNMGTYSQTFTGDKKSGTILTDEGMIGTYTVDGKNVNWTYGNTHEVIVNYTGKFTDKTNMNGTMRRLDGADSGTWVARKR